MTTYITPPDLITSGWLTDVLRASRALTSGTVASVTSRATGAFNSTTSHLELRYSADAAGECPQHLVLKRNIPAQWAIDAGIEEVKFYQLIASLDPQPPAIVPCYAAAFDATSGDSYILLQDLSATHAPAVTRDQLVGIAESVPPDAALTQVIDALAQHHAYWWGHRTLGDGSFPVGYWTRNAERLGLYLERRRSSWESLIAREQSWFPDDFRELYTHTLAHLGRHWARDLEPRFRTAANLTLVHGDAFFANVLCPKRAGISGTYLIDWQSPVADLGGYDLANLLATFWTPEQRHAGQRELRCLQRYHHTLQAYGVRSYTWDDLVADYQAGLIYWILVPVQDGADGAPRDYWWPKMQCLVAAFREWRCEALLG